MSTFSKVLISGLLASLILSIGFIIGFNQRPVHEAITGSFTPVEGTQFTLSMTALPADTTITLSSFQTPDGRNLTMSYFGAKGYGTLDPTNTTRLESISFTGITQNANGTATLTGVSRGLDFIFPYGATASLGKTHLVGSQLILSNTSAFYGNEFLLANQTGTSTAILNFASTTMPRYDLDPGAAAYTAAPNSVFVDMAQLTRTAISGATNATRFVQGLVQVAFRGDAASSTALGSTGAFEVLTTDIATSSPSISMSTSSVVMTRLDSRISPTFLATTTDTTYTLGNLIVNGTSTFIGNVAINTSASTTVAKGFYANSIAAPYFDATSTAATSTLPNISVANIAISNTCTGCTAFATSTATASLSTSRNGTGSGTATCPAGTKASGGGYDSIPGDSGGSPTGIQVPIVNGPSSASNGWTVTVECEQTTCSSGTINIYVQCVRQGVNP